jgi:hypothetical protein
MAKCVTCYCRERGNIRISVSLCFEGRREGLQPCGIVMLLATVGILSSGMYGWMQDMRHQLLVTARFGRTNITARDGTLRCSVLILPHSRLFQPHLASSLQVCFPNNNEMLVQGITTHTKQSLRCRSCSLFPIQCSMLLCNQILINTIVEANSETSRPPSSDVLPSFPRMSHFSSEKHDTSCSLAC